MCIYRSIKEFDRMALDLSKIVKQRTATSKPAVQFAIGAQKAHDLMVRTKLAIFPGFVSSIWTHHWLVVEPYLKNMSWDDDIPNMNGKIIQSCSRKTTNHYPIKSHEKPPFSYGFPMVSRKTTNQIKYGCPTLGSCYHGPHSHPQQPGPSGSPCTPLPWQPLRQVLDVWIPSSMG